MMKKNFFYAIAAMGLLAGCADNEGFAGDTDESGNPAVSLGISSSAPSVLVAKGTGTVGGITEEQNVWKGQTVRVFMFDKYTFEPTALPKGNTSKFYFYNTEVVAPYDTVTGIATRKDRIQCYYPNTGASDFWGYRTDACETGEPVKTELEMYVPFKMDGSQDLMSALTETVDADNQDGLYSAASARAGIIPNLVFSHLTTRLTFSTKCWGDNYEYGSNAEKINVTEVSREDTVYMDGNNPVSSYQVAQSEMIMGAVNKGLYIDSICVVSPTDGRLYFAWLPAAKMPEYNDKGYARIEWSDNSSERLFLKQRQSKAQYLKEHPGELDVDVDTLNLVNLHGVQPNEIDTVKIGDALFVKTQNKYKLKIYMHQYANKLQDIAMQEGDKQEYVVRSFTYPDKGDEYYDLDLKTAVDNEIKEGYSYNIHLIVAGIERIIINATLEPWKDGNGTDWLLE